MGCTRKIFLDRLSQVGQIVKRNGRKHVMLQMIPHIPIIISGQPRAGKSTGVIPKIRYVRIQSIMLRSPAKKTKPTTIKSTKGKYDNQKRMPRQNKTYRYHRMAPNLKLGPALMALSQNSILFWQDKLVPVAMNSTVCMIPDLIDPNPGVLWIPGEHT